MGRSVGDSKAKRKRCSECIPHNVHPKDHIMALRRENDSTDGLLAWRLLCPNYGLPQTVNLSMIIAGGYQWMLMVKCNTRLLHLCKDQFFNAEQMRPIVLSC